MAPRKNGYAAAAAAELKRRRADAAREQDALGRVDYAAPDMAASADEQPGVTGIVATGPRDETFVPVDPPLRECTCPPPRRWSLMVIYREWVPEDHECLPPRRERHPVDWPEVGRGLAVWRRE